VLILPGLAFEKAVDQQRHTLKAAAELEN